MQPFTVHRGVGAPLRMINVDTDMIIPKQYLTTIERTGLSAGLFDDLRRRPDGSDDPEFFLNHPRYAGAEILIAGENFGCGSSREHAPWALLDQGIRCVIAPSFADIFFNNCFKNGILPVVLPQEQVEILMREAETAHEPVFEVDLEKQEIRRPTGNESFPFDIEPFRRHCLLHGLDDIGLTLQKGGHIDTHEDRRRAATPWLEDGTAGA
jgi:3-isopropylmalate/(R)-2-methylmalate dehydratase small subunit